MVASGSPLIIGADERHDEFVGHILVVRIFHALHGIGILAAFALTVNHGVVCLQNPLPAAVAIHGVVASADAGDLAGVVFACCLLQLLKISSTVGRESVAAVHEGVDENTISIQAILFCHLQQSMKMGLIRMHAAVRKQPKKMQAASAGLRILHGLEQNRMRKEFAILDHQLNARAVHVNDAASADIQMSDFAVAHLSVRQADGWAAGLNKRVGIFAQQAVIDRLTGKCDGIGFGFGAVTPSVEDDEDERFRGRDIIRDILLLHRSLDEKLAGFRPIMWAM